MLISRKDDCWKYELRGALPAGEVSRSSGLVVLPYFDIVITKRPRTILGTMGQIGIKSFLFFRRLTWMRLMRPVHGSYIVVLAIISLENTSATVFLHDLSSSLLSHCILCCLQIHKLKHCWDVGKQRSKEARSKEQSGKSFHLILALALCLYMGGRQTWTLFLPPASHMTLTGYLIWGSAF